MSFLGDVVEMRLRTRVSHAHSPLSSLDASDLSSGTIQRHRLILSAVNSKYLLGVRVLHLYLPLKFFSTNFDTNIGLPQGKKS